MNELERVYEQQSDEDIVIVGIIGHKWNGIKPVSIRLPHQVYKQDIEKLKEQYNAERVVVIPAKSSEYFWL